MAVKSVQKSSKRSSKAYYMLAMAVAAAMGATFGSSSAKAAPFTWTGGAGATWDTSATLWGTTGTPWDSTNGPNNTAIFNTAGATPSVSGIIYAGGITFSNTATVGGAGTITLGSSGITDTLSATINAAVALSAGQSWTTASGQTLTVAGNISNGAGGLTKAGAGGLTLTGSNTYTGGTTLSAGSLTLGNANALGTGTFTISGGALDASSAFTLANNPIAITNSFTFTGSNNLNLGTGAVALSNTPTITVNAGLLTIGGSITGTGLNKDGAGTLTLSGSATYAGNTFINNGVLNISGSRVQSGASSVLIGNAAGNSVLNVTGSVTSTNVYAGNGSGFNGAVNLGPTGTISSGGNAEYSFDMGAPSGYGYFNNTGGTLTTTRFQLGGNASINAAIGGTGVAVMSAGIINSNEFVILARDAASIGDFTITGGTLTHNAASNNFVMGYQGTGRAELNVDGGLIDNSGRNINYGEGSWTGTGIVNLNAGTLTTNSITNTSGTSYLNFGGGTLRAAANSTTILPALTTVTVNGAFGSFIGGLVFDTNGLSDTISAPLLAPAGNGIATIPVTLAGSGYIGAPYVSITGTTGTGATAIANMVDDGTGKGTLKIGSITITNPGNNYSGTLSYTLTGGGTPVTAATLGTITTATNTSGGLTVIGTGVLTLTGSNTYTGVTTVNQASQTVAADLILNSASGFSVPGNVTNNGWIIISNNNQQFGPNSVMTFSASSTNSGYATLELDGHNQTLAGISGGSATAGIIQNGQVITGSGVATLTLNTVNATDNFTYSGIIRDSANSGSIALIKNGPGTQTLTGGNINYTGGTTVNAGTLVIGGSPTQSAGTIRGALTINTGGTVSADAGLWSLGYGGSSVAVSSIAINGGVLNFTGTSNAGGTSATSITMTGGTIRGTDFDWYTPSGTANATLTTNASSITSTISSGINFRLGATGTLTFNVAQGTAPSNIDLLVSGVLRNGANQTGTQFVKSGLGTMVLSGNNSYTGGTTVSAGRLVISSATGAASSTASIYVASGAVFENAYTGVNYTLSKPWTIAGTFIKDGNSADTMGVLTLIGGTLTSTGALDNVNHGNFLFGSGSITSTGNSLINATSTGAVGINGFALPISVTNAADVLTISAPIISSGGFTKSGAGTLALTGINTYSSGTTVYGGTLLINNTSGSGTGTGLVTVNGNATASSFGTLAGSGTISGSVTLATNGATSFALGAVLAPGGIGTAGTLTVAGLTSNSFSNLTLDLSASHTSGDDLIHFTGTTAPIINGATQININALATLSAGLYTLVNSYTGTIGNFGSLTLNVTGDTGHVYSLQNNSGALQLFVAGATPANAVWSGATDANWTTQDTTTAATNWRTDATSNIDTFAVPGASTNVTFSTTTPGALNTATTLGQNFSINSLTINSAASITGNTLTLGSSGTAVTVAASTAATINSAVALGASQTWSVGAGGTLTTAGAISGTGFGLTKAGTGTLTLTGANIYTGGTTISSGLLQIGDGTNGHDGALTSPTIANTAALVFNTSGTQSYSGSISGSGGTLTKLGAGKLTLGGSNSYTGATSINAGTLNLTGSLGNTATTIATGTTLMGNGNNSTTGIIGGAVSNSAGGGFINLTTAGSTLTLNGLTLGNGNSYGAGNYTTMTYTLGNGLLDIGTAGSSTGLLTVNSGGGFVSIIGSPAVGTYTLANFGSSSGISNFSLSSSTAGVTTLANGFNTFTLIENATNLKLQVAGTAIPTAYFKGGVSTVWNDAGSSPTSNWSSNLAGTTDAGNTPGSLTDVILNANTQTGTVSTTLGADTTINSLTVNGNGTNTIAAGNVLTINATTANGHTLGDGITVGSAAHAFTINAALALGNNQTWTNASANLFTIGGTVSGTAVTGTQTLTLASSSTGGTTVGGAIADGSGGGHLAVIVNSPGTGTGVTTFTGPNTYTGNTTVNQPSQGLVINDLVLNSASGFSIPGNITNNGWITIGNSNQQFGPTSVMTFSTTNVNSGFAGFELDGHNQTLAGISGGTLNVAGFIENAQANVGGGAGTLTLNTVNASDNFSYGGTIRDAAGGGTGTIALIKTGSGTQTLTGGYGYTGSTTVSQGVLTMAGSGQMASSNVTIGSSGTLNLSGSANNQFGAPSGTLTVNGTLAVTTNTVNTLTFSTISMTGGTITNTFGQNTVGGALYINGAASKTITANGTGNTISGLGVIGMQTGAILTLNTPLSGDTLSITGTLGQTALSGDAGGLTKSGLGTVILSGANIYTGATTISGGALQLNNALAVQNSTISINSANGLTYGAGVGTFTLGGLSGASNDALAATDTSAVVVAAGNNNATTTYSGILSGIGSLNKIGTGTLILTGNNTNTGATTISNGVLQMGNGSNTGLIGNDTAAIVNNSSLVINRNDAGLVNYANSISGSGSLTLNGGGYAYLSGANTFTGITTITNGSFLATQNANSTLGTTPASFVANQLSFTGTGGSLIDATSSFSNTGANIVIDANRGIFVGSEATATFRTTFSGVFTINSVISGTGNIAKTDGGNAVGLILNAPNTFSGTTSWNNIGGQAAGGWIQLGTALALQNSTVNENYTTAGQTTGLVFAGGIGTFTLGGLGGAANQTLTDVASAAVNLRVGNNNANTIYSGVLSGSGSLTKIGSGTLFLGNSNTYTGNTAIATGTVALNGSLAHYTFDGSNANDSAGTNNGTLVGSPTFVTGFNGSGKAISLNGTNQDVTVPYSATLPTTAFTVSLWENLNSLTGGGTFISTRPGGDHTFDIQYASDGTLHGDIGNGAGTWLTTAANATGVTLVPGAWNMITFTANSSGYSIFVNGNPVVTNGSYTTAGTPLFMQQTSVLTLGIQPGTAYMNGLLDEVNIFGAVLSSSQVNALYLSELGSLAPAAGSFLPTTTNLTIASGAVLDLQGANQSVASLGDFGVGNSGTVTNGLASTASILTVTPASGNTTFSGVIQDGAGTVAFGKAGTGTQTLSGANTYSGGTTITAGKLIVTNTTGSATGTGAVTVSGSGTLAGSTASAQGFISGPVNINSGGTLAASNLAQLTLSGGLAFATSSIASFNLTGTPNGTTDGAALINITGGNFTTAGANGTTVNITGTPQVGIYDLFGFSGTMPALNDFQIGTNPNGYVGTLVYGTNQIDLIEAQPLIWTGNAGSGGTGNWDTTSLNWANNVPTAAAFATLDPVTFQDSNPIPGNANVTNFNVVVQGAVSPSSIAFTNNSVTYTISNAGGATGITGSTGITKSGTGTVILAGSNSYTGGTTVTAGILQVNADHALGNATTTVTSGGELLLNGVLYGNSQSLSIAGTGISNAGVLAATGTSSFAGAITLGDNSTIGASLGSTLTLSGPINQGGQGLTLAGGGTININGGTSGTTGSTFDVNGATVNLNSGAGNAGTTTIENNGLLRLGASGSLPFSPTPALVVETGGTLDINGNSPTVSNLTLSSGTIMDTLSGGTLGVSTGVTVNGSGNAINATVNASSGLVLSAFGSLTIGATGSVTTPTMSVGTSGNLVVNGAVNADVNLSDNVSLSGTGTITGSNVGAFLANNDTLSSISTLTFDGLTINGTGNQITSGNVAATFMTTINPGADLTINTGATLISVVAQSGNLTVNGMLNGTTDLQNSAALAGTGNITGGVTLAGSNPVSSTGTLSLGSTLGVSGTGNQITSGTVAVAGSTTISGGANLTVNGHLSDASTVAVSGTLLVGDASHPSATFSSTGMTVNSGGILGGHGTITGPVSVSAGGTVEPGGSIGTLTIAGAYTQGSSTYLGYILNTPVPGDYSMIDVTGGLLTIGTGVEVDVSGTTALGIYHLFMYDDGLSGTTTGWFATGIPGGDSYFFSTATTGEVNLIITAPEAVPEPTSLGLLGLGALGLLGRKRRKNRA